MSNEDGFFWDVNEIAGKRIVNTPSLEDNPCSLCGLNKKCSYPRQGMSGNGDSGILVVGESPFHDLDKEPFAGEEGGFLDGCLAEFGMELTQDCKYTNVQQCFSSEDGFDESKLEFCHDRLEMQIYEFNPSLILCFGVQSAKRIIGVGSVPGLRSNSLVTSVGDVYPVRQYGSWVSVNPHLIDVMATKENKELQKDRLFKALQYIDKPFPIPRFATGDNILLNRLQALSFLKKLATIKSEVSLDYEATGLLPYAPNFKLLSIQFSVDGVTGYVLDLRDSTVFDATSVYLKSNNPKCFHKFDDTLTRASMGHGINGWVTDIMISKHILDERPGKKSLAFQSFETSGEEYKGIVDNRNMESEFKNNTINFVKYGSLDARFPVDISKRHWEELTTDNLTYPMKFFMQGQEVLSQMEAHGVKIDVPAYNSFRDEVSEKRVVVDDFFDGNEHLERYAAKYGKRPDMRSNPDLQKLFFQVMDLKPISHTEKTKSPQVNDAFYSSVLSLGGEAGEFITNFQEWKQLSKLSSTYLDSIDKYIDSRGFLHPVYNLWIPRTYRGSCDSPNLQNVPNRNEFLRSFRKIFIPEHDLFMEADYKGAEVVIQAIMAQDKVLLDQLNNNFDMHKYWAHRLFKLPESEITKVLRHRGKNEFVFPKLYGSYFVSIAAVMGIPEKHVHTVEREFDGLYYGVKKWQDKMVKIYSQKGYVPLPLGFKRRAPLSHNQIVNTPIQGTAFHCLLDSLIRIVHEINRRGLLSFPVLQVHDSILFDTVASEREELQALADKYTKDKSHWKWCRGAELKVDWEQGKNWLEMA